MEVRLREARDEFFARSGLPPDGGYSGRFFRIGFGPVAIPLPNVAARVAAVRLHDLHHVLTGYDTSWTGEAEIGAWELASGCGAYWAAWLLNFGAFAIGLAIAPRRLWTAFRRGRRSTNFYGSEPEEMLLALAVEAARQRLGLDLEPGPPNAGERVHFALWTIASLAAATLALAALFLLAHLTTKAFR